MSEIMPVGIFEFPLTVRYMEVDAQSVVFNAWYLTYFDEAFAAFLVHRGLPYAKLQEAGFETQLVRSEIDWRAGLRWQDDFVVAVSTVRLGRTSFTLSFETRRGSEVTCIASTVYVLIGADGSGKQEIPEILAEALSAPMPRREGAPRRHEVV